VTAFSIAINNNMAFVFYLKTSAQFEQLRRRSNRRRRLKSRHPIVFGDVIWKPSSAAAANNCVAENNCAAENIQQNKQELPQDIRLRSTNLGDAQ
jgi:hypothetical protein